MRPFCLTFFAFYQSVVHQGENHDVEGINTGDQQVLKGVRRIAEIFDLTHGIRGYA